MQGAYQAGTDALENAQARRASWTLPAELVATRSIAQVILDSSADGIELLDGEGAILFLNAAARHALSANCVNAASWPLMWPPEGARQAEGAIAQARTGAATRFGASRHDKHGKERWFDVMVSPVRISDTVTHILAVSRDVTAHHEMEEELRREKQKADMAMLAKTEVVADLSHELRAPLTAILAYADMLGADPTLSPTQRNHVQSVESGAMTLLALAQDLLDVAQVENGEGTLQAKPFVLQTVIDEAMMMEGPSAKAKLLALSVEARGEIGISLCGDPDRLRQVILNLLGNAIKFTPRGSVTLCVDVDRTERGLCRVVIAVRDTGIGIPADQLSLLCQRFSSNDVFSGLGVRGAGLGLAIVKRLVTRMGGTLTVVSRPSIGSTFEITLALPLAKASSATIALPANAKPFPDARILVVEDVPICQAATRALLERLGCQVDVVSGGRLAITAVKDKPYDLVLMDQQLDDVSGTQATRAIRDLGYPLNAVPIVSCSGESLQRGWQGYADAGMSGWMTKPTSLVGLAEDLRRYLPVVEPIGGAGTEGPKLEAAERWLPEDLIGPAVAQLDAEIAALASVDLLVEDARSIARQVHRLLSTARVLGFLPLAECCERFETSLAAGEAVEAALNCFKDAGRSLRT